MRRVGKRTDSRTTIDSRRMSRPHGLAFWRRTVKSATGPGASEDAVVTVLVPDQYRAAISSPKPSTIV